MGFHQDIFRSRASQAFLGMLAFASEARTKTLRNATPQRKQVGTITVDTATDGTVYTWTINGITESLTSGTSETTTTIATKIAAAINANPQQRAWVTATSSGAVVTLTANEPGIAFTASDADSRLTTVQASTAALTADSIPAGRWCVEQGWSAEDPDMNVGLGSLAAAAYLTAQTARWTYTFEASLQLVASVVLDGVTYLVTHTSATDATASIAALVAKLNQALPDSRVVATASTATITLTAAAGVDLVADVYFGTAVGGAGALAKGTGSNLVVKAAGTSVALGGVAVRRIDDEPDSSGDQAFPPNAGFEIVKSGHIWVENSEAPASHGTVYVYVGATAADRGKLYAAPGTDRLPLDSSVAYWTGKSDATGELALLYVDTL